MKRGYVYIGVSIAIVVVGTILIFQIFGNGTLSGLVYSHRGMEKNWFYNDYEINIFSNDGHTVVAKTHTDANGHYSIQLPAGKYIIYEKQTPYTVKIIADQNTTFNIIVQI